MRSKKEIALYQKEYRLKNKAVAFLYQKEYRLKNKEKTIEYQKKNRKRILEGKRVYRVKNHKKIARAKKIWDLENKGRVSAWGKIYRSKNKERIKEAYARWYKKNLPSISKRVNIRSKERYLVDVQYKLSTLLRRRLLVALRGNSKAGSAVRDLGCSISGLKSYLEGRFLPGMTWGNLTVRGWHIDHIIPLSSFDLTDRGQFLKAAHYTNLQPLWAADNLRKGSKIIQTRQ